MLQALTHLCAPEQRVRTFGVVFQDPRSQFFMNSVQDEIAFSAENIRLEPMYVKEKVSKCTYPLT